MIWKYAKMHQNTFLTTADDQKYFFSDYFSGGLEDCENAAKRVFNHYRLSKISYDSGGLEVCENAPKHVFNHCRRSKISFLKKVSGGMEVCANASKHVFNHSRR